MKLIDTFARVLREKKENISDATSRKTTRRWDSMSHVQLVVALEDTFNVKLSALEIDALTSVAAAREILTSKGVVDL